jgi:hypothetical protein
VDRLVEHTRSYRGPCAEYGERVELGDGELTAYSQAVGSRPVSVGLIMTDDSLDDLPHDPPTDGTWCFDKNGDGTVDPMTECSGGYEKQLDLGAKFQREVDTPYTYVLTNWNPHGHIPPGSTICRASTCTSTSTRTRSGPRSGQVPARSW